MSAKANPTPKYIYPYLRNWAFLPPEAIVFEDSEVGMQAAQAAGIGCINVNVSCSIPKQWRKSNMSDTNKPLISVVAPVYNTSKYLRWQCIESVINQSYENWELILVDDGATDESPLICDEYAKKESRIKVIHQRNQGLSVARNNGISAAMAKI